MSDVRAGFILVIAFVVFIGYLFYGMCRSEKNYHEKYSKYVGKKIIIDGDTTVILDYIYIGEVRYPYVLSNGLQVREIVIENGKLIQE